MAKIPLAFLFIFYADPSYGGPTSKLVEAKELYQQGEFQTAYDRLYQIPLGDLDPKRMALIQLFRGVLNYEMKNYPDALIELERSIKMGTRLQDLGHFYKGMALMKTQNYSAAEIEFNSVTDWNPSDFLKERVQYHLADIALQTGKEREARKLLKKLERKMRRSDLYPGILYSLMQLDSKNRKKRESCLWARKLYRGHPTFGKIKDWGLKWDDNKLDGKPLACRDNLNDRKARLRRLQWLGASQKAFSELQEFDKSDEEPFDKSVIMAEYLINEGHVTEALKKLLPFYKEKIEDFKFNMLLAKAAARSGEFQTAIGVYSRAAKSFKGSKSRTALFRAAFLSYQHQDYDGALRRFLRLKKRHPGTSLTRQANWYIPWLYYLRGNYQEAYNLFQWALSKKSRRLPRRIGEEQIKYWIGMSLLKMDRKGDAEKVLSEISHDDFIGYYSVAAVQRLRELAGGRVLAMTSQSQSVSVHENWLPNGSSSGRSPSSLMTMTAKNNSSYFREWENLPFMQEYLQMGNPAEIYTQVAVPELRSHIERAKDFATIGMMNLAKWELYSIEKRTQNKDYLKTLMFEYHRNGIYHRSSYLGSRQFADLRSHLGIHLGASLWQFVYPRAFEKDVVGSADRFNVPAEFVWSIMKAETNFRPDAISPVGAKGLMQVMPHTGKKVASLMGKNNLQGKDLLKPHVSVEIGSRYLHRLLKKFQNKIPLAAAAYNGGPHRVHAWLSQFGHLEMDEFIEHIPFLETRNYVKKVTRYYAVYNLLYNKNNEASSWLADLVDVHLDGSPPTKETWEVL